MHSRTDLWIRLGVLAALAVVPLEAAGQSVHLDWLDRYGAAGNLYDQATAIALGPDGSVYVTGNGQSVIPPWWNCTTVKYGPAGQRVWARNYKHMISGQSGDQCLAIALDSAGNVIVAGRSHGGAATQSECLTVKYDNAGNELWVRRYDGALSGDDSCRAVAVDPDDNVYVAGNARNPTTFAGDILLIKYAPDGTAQWVRTYDGPGHRHDEARALVFDGAAGALYLAGGDGGVAGTGEFDFATFRYAPDGTLVWLRRLNGSGNGADIAGAIALDGLGNVIVAGQNQGSSPDAVTAKYAADGALLWQARYDGPPHGPDFVKGLGVDAAGNVYVSSQSNGVTADFFHEGYDFATIKYDAGGAEQWVRRYDGPAHSHDSPAALAVDSFGDVYVTGGSVAAGSNVDYLTILYDTDGNQVWLDRYDGGGIDADLPSAIAADDYGHAWVTGQSPRPATSFDFLTIAYTGPLPLPPDADGDGTPDSADGCPLDADKIAPGSCGCGVSDVDSDGDGTADCHDDCAADPDKTEPGVCGCGASDSDSDGDGTADCHDGCAADPAKTTSGACGCGVADDADGDGALSCGGDCADTNPAIRPGAAEACDGSDNDCDGQSDEGCAPGQGPGGDGPPGPGGDGPPGLGKAKGPQGGGPPGLGKR